MVADSQVVADYSDEAAIKTFCEIIDIATFEFENIPASSLDLLAENIPVYPRKQALHICQNRQREKEFLRQHNIPCAPFEVVSGPQELEQEIAQIGCPCVLKTADFGYDGKGQTKIENGDVDVEKIWEQHALSKGVLEKWIPFKAECSVIIARNSKCEQKVTCLALLGNRSFFHDHPIAIKLKKTNDSS